MSVTLTLEKLSGKKKNGTQFVDHASGRILFTIVSTAKHWYSSSSFDFHLGDEHGPVVGSFSKDKVTLGTSAPISVHKYLNYPNNGKSRFLKSRRNFYHNSNEYQLKCPGAFSSKLQLMAVGSDAVLAESTPACLFRGRGQWQLCPDAATNEKEGLFLPDGSLSPFMCHAIIAEFALRTVETQIANNAAAANSAASAASVSVGV